MKTPKKQQHYIWKYYLKPWTVDDKICCLRNGNSFLASLNNIAQIRYFYEAEPLNESELDYIKSFILNLHPSAWETQFGYLNMYIKASLGDEYLRTSGIEDYYFDVEKKFTPILNLLYEGDISYHNDRISRGDLSLFLGTQYARTNKMREGYKTLDLGYSEKFDMNKIGRVMALLFGDLIGQYIFSNFGPILLVNETKVDFITGDQPVLNTCFDLNQPLKVDNIELYFPISPQYAIYLSRNKATKQVVSEEEVIKYNKLIVLHSKEQIYAKKMSCFTSC